MMFKTFGRTFLFALLCSIIGLQGTTLRADTAQDCAKAKKIVQRVYNSVCRFITSGSPKVIVDVHTYLRNLKPSEKIPKTIVNKIFACTTALLEKMRSSSKNPILELKSILLSAFEKFGNDIEALASEVKAIDNTLDVQELSTLIEKLPREINQRIFNLNIIKKGALATKIAVQVWRKKF